MDGWVTLGTQLSTKEFDKKYEQLKRKVEKSNIKLEIKANELEKAKKELNDINYQLDGLKKRRKELEGKINPLKEMQAQIRTKMNNHQPLSGAEAQNWEKLRDRIPELEKELNSVNSQYGRAEKSLENQYDVVTKIDREHKEQEKDLKLVNREYEEYVKKRKEEQEEEQKQQKNNFFGDIGKNIDSNIKKIAKWGLALFGIRGIYGMISSAMSTLSAQDETLAADIEYIRWVIATTLKPVVEFIVQLVYQLLGLINMVTSALFGTAIFADKTRDAFARQKQELKGSNKQAKDLQKTLAGFDEMNILQKNGGVSGGGGGGGVPQMDIPTSLDWAEDLKDKALDWTNGLYKFFKEDLPAILETVTGAWKTFFQGLADIATGIYDFISGIGEVFIGVFDMIIGIITLDTDKIWEGFGIICDGIKNMFQGIAEFFSGIIDTIVGLIDGVVDFIGGIIKDFLDGIGKWFDETFGWLFDAIEGFIDWFENTVGDFLGGIVQGFIDAYDIITGKINGMNDDVADFAEEVTEDAKQVNDANQTIMESYEKGSDEVKNYVEGLKTEIEMAKKTIEAKKEYNDEASLFTQAMDGMTGATDKNNRIMETNLDQIVNCAKNLQVLAEQGKLTDEQMQLYNETMAYLNEEYEDNIDLIEAAKEPLSLAGRLVDENTIKIFDQIEALQKNDEKVKQTTDAQKQEYKDLKDEVVNDMKTINGLEANPKIKVKTDTSSLSTLQKSLKNLFNIGFGFSTGGVITKLATGAIVNQPGRGVPVANSYMGEAGREGILPLTDSQAMETLGAAIGKYININATVPVYVGNRQVAREIRKIEAEDDFAYNS